MRRAIVRAPGGTRNPAGGERGASVARVCVEPMDKRRAAYNAGGRSTRIPMKTAILLTISNVFMTFAWYGHLKFKGAALWVVVLVSWLIAFFEYCFQVPANRIGSNAGMSGAQLKILQEAITLIVFVVFAVAYLKEQVRWNHVAACGLVMAAVVVVNLPAKKENPAASAGRDDQKSLVGQVAEAG